MEKRPPIWRVAANVLNKQSRTVDKKWSSSLRVGRNANNSSPKKTDLVNTQIHFPRIWSDPLVRSQQRKRDMKFGTRKVRSLHRAGSLTAAARELARQKLDLVCVQEVRWGKRVHGKSTELYFFLWKGKLKS